MKQWAVISYVQQKRQKQGHLISPQIIEAETRREAKVKFREKYPVWMMCELVASPYKSLAQR